MQNSRTYRLLMYSLLAFAFLLPLSIALVQPAAYLASVLALIYFISNRTEYPGRFPFRWSILIFLCAIVVTAFTGARPGHSFEKMNRFFLFFIVWGIPYSIHGRKIPAQWLTRLVVAFVFGATLKAAYDIVRVPVEVQMGTPLFETGNMRDPQMYYVAICLVAGMFMTRNWRFRYPPALVSLLVLCSGFVIHFKRGAWISCLCALIVMAVVSRKWRYIWSAVLAAVILISLPQTRDRIDQFKDEFDVQGGGRMTLWTEVAPALIKANPLGMGWKGVRHEDFVAVSDRVESGLNHLHNNVLEITLELSVAGLLAWLFLIGTIFAVLLKSYRIASAHDSSITGITLGCFGAFTGLMINGLVEYNFGDSEVFMIMVLVMGLAAGAYAQQNRKSVF